MVKIRSDKVLGILKMGSGGFEPLAEARDTGHAAQSAVPGGSRLFHDSKSSGLLAAVPPPRVAAEPRFRLTEVYNFDNSDIGNSPKPCNQASRNSGRCCHVVHSHNKTMTRKMKPKEAAERYLKERKPNVSKSTLYNHRSLLRQFWKWCDEHDIQYVNNLDGFDISDFRLERQLEIGEVTLYNQMTVLRVFVKWCQSRELVPNGLADGMTVAQPSDDSRNSIINAEAADAIINYLNKYEYGTLKHISFTLIWHTSMRLGAVRSLDIEHYRPQEHYLELEHQPESDTPLKNGNNSEREVNLAIWMCDLLDDYIADKRHDVTDEYGREPLLTTEHGRSSHSNIREHINQITRPCVYRNECPHERDVQSCEATSRIYAARCPSSIPPHDLRRSSVTHMLDNGNRKELLADRVDMSVDTMDKHYDKRSEEQKRKSRRAEFGMN